MLPPGQSLPPLSINVNGVPLDEGQKTFFVESEVFSLIGAGVECTAQDESQFSVGFLPPVKSTPAPMPTVTPPPTTATTALPPTGVPGTPGPTPVDNQTIAAILAADGRFTELVSLADGVGLIPPLMSAGPITIFAPTDAAFDALGLNPDATDPIIISTLLLYHIAAGLIPLEDGLGVETLNGRSVILTVTETETKVNEANIVETIPASNGVIYVIDAVLIPPTNPPFTTP